MQLGINVILLLVGFANAMPSDILPSEDVDDVVREKRDSKNQISFDLSHGSRSGTQGMLTYTRRFRRDAPEEQIPLAEEVDDAARQKREYKNEIRFDLSRGSRSGTQGMLTYTRRFRRDAPEVQIPLTEEADDVVREKRDSKNHLNFELSHGSRSGTQGMLTYTRRFRRDAPEEQIPLAEEVDGAARQKREYKNEIRFDLSRGSRSGTQGMLTYTRRFRRDAPEEQIPLAEEVDDVVREKRDSKNQLNFELSHGSRSGTQGMLTYTRRFRRDAPEEQMPLAEEVDDATRQKRESKNEIRFDLSHDRRSGNQGMITYTRRFRRDAPEEQIPLAEEVDDAARLKRESKNEIRFDLSHDRRSGNQGMLTYTRRFRRDAPEEQIPLAEEVDDVVREKRDSKNQLNFELSHGSRSGTQGMLTYTRRFRRDAPEEQIPLAEEVDDAARLKRESKNEIRFDLSHDRRSGNQGMLTYTRRFRRDAPEEQIPLAEEVDDVVREKRDSKNQLNFELSHGSRSGTQGMLTYTRRFRRDAPEEQIPLAEEVDGAARQKRESKNEIRFDLSHDRRSGNQGMITYTRRFRRDAPEEQIPLAEEVDDAARLKRESKNEIRFDLSHDRRSGNQGMITYTRRFRRDAPEEQIPLAEEVDDAARLKRESKNEIRFDLSHDRRSGNQGMITYTRRFRRNLG